MGSRPNFGARIMPACASRAIAGRAGGHQHDNALIYKAQRRDIFSANAAFLGGFAVVRVIDASMNVVFAEAGPNGSVRFTDAFFSKPMSTRRRA